MNRIAKIEARGNGLARLFDADGAQIGDLDAWVSCPSRLVYNGDQLACGARAWIETNSRVTLIDEMSFAEGRAAA